MEAEEIEVPAKVSMLKKAKWKVVSEEACSRSAYSDV